MDSLHKNLADPQPNQEFEPGSSSNAVKDTPGKNILKPFINYVLPGPACKRDGDCPEEVVAVGDDGQHAPCQRVVCGRVDGDEAIAMYGRTGSNEDGHEDLPLHVEGA